MSWLQKRPQFANPSVFYTVGINKTILIVGLGNIGKKYDLTRHNIGFNCIEDFIKNNEEFGSWTLKKDLKCEFNSGQLGDKRVLVIKPTTLMNNSGEAVLAVLNFYKIEPINIIVLHDELDINFGQIRTRYGGSDAGHNGIKSVTKSLGSDGYGRVRVGIGPKKPARVDSSDFVLSTFSKEEKEHIPNLYKEVNAILSEYIYGDSMLASETRSFII